ncbi:MAG: hypothetical protein AB1730_17810 [Myxococcota bacterium]
MATPSIAAVTPRKLAVGLTAEVQVSGFATSWTQDVVVSFGADVVVKAVRVTGPTSLVATISVPRDALVGPRTVSVQQGTTQVTYPAFEVGNYADLTIEGFGKQGGLLKARVTVNDPNFVFSNPSYLGPGARVRESRLDVLPSDGINVVSVSVMARTFEVLLGVDVAAPVGPRSILLQQNPNEGDEVNFAFPNAFQVTARTPVTIPSLPATVTFGEPFDSVIFSVPTNMPLPDGAILLSTAGAGRPLTGYLPAYGEWTPYDATVGRVIAPADSPMNGYVVVFDDSGVGGTASLAYLAPETKVESEPNDDVSTATDLGATFPVRVTGAIATTMPSGMPDVDVFKVSLPAAAAGQRLLVLLRERTTGFYADVRVRQFGTTVGWGAGFTEPLLPGDVSLTVQSSGTFGDYDLVLLIP